MAEDPGPIVVDPHAFERLWPLLGIWLLLFVTGGDAWTLSRRALARAAGTPAEAIVEGQGTATLRWLLWRERRTYVEFAYEEGGIARRGREPVGRAERCRPRAGSRRAVHILGRAAFLDDDCGYSLWKWSWFGGAFIALWLWAAARYRFSIPG